MYHDEKFLKISITSLSLRKFFNHQYLSQALLLTTLVWATNTQAMSAGMSDESLIRHSQLIVKATYIGQSQVRLNETGNVLTLGVLNVDDTLKGNKQEVIFIQLPPVHGPHKSDDIVFRSGQYGLWFLKENRPQQNIYSIDHLQRFIPEKQFGNRIPSLLKLLDSSIKK